MIDIILENMISKYEPTIEDVTALSNIDTLPPGRLDIARRMAIMSGMSEGKKVLVVSSHRGYQAAIYAKEFGANVCGLDIDKSMIEYATRIAEENKVQINYVEGDAQKLPFQDNSFDIVTDEGAVGIPQNPQQVLNEMVRVLKPGGVMIFRESIFSDGLDEDEKYEICQRYGNNIQDRAGWIKMIELAGVVVSECEIEPWSRPEFFWDVRHDRTVETYDNIYTTMEKLFISKKIMKQYGAEGMKMASENEKEFYKAVIDKKIGYGIFCSKKGVD